MTTSAPTPRYQEKQAWILSVASRVFARKGYHAASMRDIARESDTSLAGLYYYARSKEELLHAISTQTFDTVIDGARRSVAEGVTAEDRLTRIIENHLAYFAQHLDEMKVLSQEADSLTGAFGEAIQERKRAYVALVENVLLTMDGDHDRKVETLALFGMMNWLYTWYRPDEGSIEPIAATMTRLFLRGYRATAEADR